MEDKNKNLKEKVQVVVFKGKDSLFSQNFKNKYELEVLLLQTNKDRGEFWQNVTGSREDDDGNINTSALRELDEETGLVPDDFAFFKIPIIHDFVDQYDNNVKEFCFGVYFDKNVDIQIESKEHQSFKWISYADVSEKDLKFSSNLETIHCFYNFLKNLEQK